MSDRDARAKVGYFIVVGGGDDDDCRVLRGVHVD